MLKNNGILSLGKEWSIEGGGVSTICICLNIGGGGGG